MTVRILLIEDSQRDAELLAHAMRTKHFSVLIATNADDGLVVTRTEQPDMVVCDINLIGMDGYQFATVFKSDQRIKHIPLIAITGGAIIDQTRAFESGFNDFLVKDSDGRVLVTRLLELMTIERRSQLLHRIHISRQVESISGRVTSVEGRMQKVEETTEATRINVDNLRADLLKQIGSVAGAVFDTRKQSHLLTLIVFFIAILSATTLIAVLAK